MRREAEQLLALADAIDACLPEHRGLFLKPWRAKVQSVLSNPELETLQGENRLEALSLELRNLWLRYAHDNSAKLMMSPPHPEQKYLPDMTRIGYPYDRWLKPEILEQRLSDESAVPQGWSKTSVAFSSGMAAITSVLLHHRASASRYWPGVGTRLGIHWFGGYFEITRVLRLICDSTFQGRHHADQATLNAVVAKGLGDIVMIEPVAANLDLHVFDLDAFIHAWRQSITTDKSDTPRRPRIIVIDSSLVADTFPVHRLCEELGAKELGPDGPALVIDVRSGLKLDQQGLELSNVGLVTIYAHEHARFGKTGRIDLEDIADNLRLVRTSFGASLSGDEYAALSAPFFLNPASRTSHAQAVFANNAHFAAKVNDVLRPDTGLIRSVIHPSLKASLKANKDIPWAVSPFVNITYSGAGEGIEGSDLTRKFFNTVLKLEARNRELTFQSGSSFGFRAHRFEMGFVRGHKYDSLRVAIGARPGPSLDGVIDLFHHFASFDDMDALRAAYPGVLEKVTNATRPSP